MTARMEGTVKAFANRFSAEQIAEIRELLELKVAAPSEKKKPYRDRLRKMGFKITEWRSSGREFGPEDLDSLVTE